MKYKEKFQKLVDDECYEEAWLFLYQYGFGVLFPVTVPADCRWGAVSPEKDVRSGSGQRRQFPGSVPYDIIKIPFHFCHFPPDLRE